MDKRKKRVKRLKSLLLVMFFTFAIVPSVFCVYLLSRINGLNHELKSVKNEVLAQMQELEEQVAESVTAEDLIGTEDEDGKDDSGYIQNKEDDVPDGIAESVNADKDSEPGYDEADTEEIPISYQWENKAKIAKKVYLTFDDGPGQNTGQILDILDQYQAKATFFVIGKEDESSLELYRRILEKGHTLGMHSYSHQYDTIYKSEKAFKKDYKKISNLLEEITGEKPWLYRFPGGSSNQVSSEDMKVFISYLDGQEVTYFDWNVSSGDAVAKVPSPEQLCQTVLEGVEKYVSSVVLLHDLAGKENTIKALPSILEQLNREQIEVCAITPDTIPVQHVPVERVRGE